IVGTGYQPTDEAAGFVNLVVDSWAQAIKQPDKKLSVGNGVTDLAFIGAADPSELGYYYVPDETAPSHHRIIIQTYPVLKFDSLTSVTQTVDTIRNAALDAVKDYPEFQIAVTGRPALEADQMRTTDHDSHKAEACALIIVFIGMAIMLRS